MVNETLEAFPRLATTNTDIDMEAPIKHKQRPQNYHGQIRKTTTSFVINL